MRNPAKVADLLLALPGVIALFLPFVGKVSPLDTILWSWKGEWLFALLGAPFFLAIPIAIWQARKLFADRLSSFEIAGAYVLSAGAMISVLAFTILRLVDKNSLEPIDVLVILFPCWALLVANVVLLWRNLAKHMTREAAAEVFLIGGYLPNAVFCLIGFGWDLWRHLQIGAGVVLIACIGYLISIVLTLRAES